MLNLYSFGETSKKILAAFMYISYSLNMLGIFMFGYSIIIAIAIQFLVDFTVVAVLSYRETLQEVDYHIKLKATKSVYRLLK
jgi:hypothetical protein